MVQSVSGGCKLNPKFAVQSNTPLNKLPSHTRDQLRRIVVDSHNLFDLPGSCYGAGAWGSPPPDLQEGFYSESVGPSGPGPSEPIGKLCFSGRP